MKRVNAMFPDNLMEALKDHAAKEETNVTALLIRFAKLGMAVDKSSDEGETLVWEKVQTGKTRSIPHYG
ncbi:hypothetical protein ACFLZC_00090 [Patescibacteria group bacterium]